MQTHSAAEKARMAYTIELIKAATICKQRDLSNLFRKKLDLEKSNAALDKRLMDQAIAQEAQQIQQSSDRQAMHVTMAGVERELRASYVASEYAKTDWLDCMTSVKEQINAATSQVPPQAVSGHSNDTFPSPASPSHALSTLPAGCKRRKEEGQGL